MCSPPYQISPRIRPYLPLSSLKVFKVRSPEFVHFVRNAAAAFLTKWTNAGDLTLKTFKDDRGKFGRILGEIWYGGEHNINQLLVDNHHAVRYHGQSKDEIAEEHIVNRGKVKLS